MANKDNARKLKQLPDTVTANQFLSGNSGGTGYEFKVVSSDWSNVTNKPTTVSGYGITDVYTKTQVDSIVSTVDPNSRIVNNYGITINNAGTLQFNSVDSESVDFGWNEDSDFRLNSSTSLLLSAYGRVIIGGGTGIVLGSDTTISKLIVNDTGVVTNLNAEKLNGYVPADFAGVNSVYTKTQSDAKYALAGASYTKSETDTKYALSSDVYSKVQSDAKYSVIGASYSKAESDARYALATPPPANFGFVYAPTGIDIDAKPENSFVDIFAARLPSGSSSTLTSGVLEQVSGTNGITLANVNPTSVAATIPEFNWSTEFKLPALTPNGTDVRFLFFGIIDSSGSEGSNTLFSDTSPSWGTGIIQKGANSSEWGVAKVTGNGTWFNSCGNLGSYKTYDATLVLNADTWYRMELKFKNVASNTECYLKIFNATNGATLVDTVQTFGGVYSGAINGGKNPRAVLVTGVNGPYNVKPTDFSLRRWIEVRS